MNKSNYQSPTYLEKFVSYENEEYFNDIDLSIEWRGQIQSSTKNKKFRVKFYGEILKEYGLITGDEFSEALIVAEDIETKEEIVIFDGCKHGYNSMFCDEFSEKQLKNRPLKIFRDNNGNEIFEIIIRVYHGIDYDEEIEDFLNEENKVELLSGELITEEELKRNGFDFLGIQVVNEHKEKINIVEEELA